MADYKYQNLRDRYKLIIQGDLSDEEQIAENPRTIYLKYDGEYAFFNLKQNRIQRGELNFNELPNTLEELTDTADVNEQDLNSILQQLGIDDSFKKQAGSNETAHPVHFINYEDNGENRAIVYKENKHGNPLASIYEAAFSELAELFMWDDTPAAHIVKYDYHLRSVTERPINPEPGKIYLTSSGDYWVIDPYGKLQCGQIPIDDNNTVYSQDFEHNLLNKHFKDHVLSHTSKQQHTLEHNKYCVSGIAIEDIKYVIQRRESKRLEKQGYNFEEIKVEPRFYKIVRDANFISDDNDCGVQYQFLNKMPPEFFDQLLQRHEKCDDELSIDMDSLASCLCGAYALEEDDLHKGNVGFYVVNDLGSPRVIFFKIDHDLMLSDSIMSRMDARVNNSALSRDAFNISPSDLKKFPDIEHSQNHYWPTKKRYGVKPGDNKVYSSADRNAFKSLKNKPEFQQAKWKQFLKYALIPDRLVKYTLDLHLDPSIDDHLADSNMIALAMVERMAKFRASLWSSPEFIRYVRSDKGQKELAEAKAQISAYLTDPRHQEAFALTIDQVPSEANLKTLQKPSHPSVSMLGANMVDFNNKCELYQSGDTPLHMALRLGDYRFEETHAAFEHYWNKENGGRERPIDIAIDRLIDEMDTLKQAEKYVFEYDENLPNADPIEQGVIYLSMNEDNTVVYLLRDLQGEVQQGAFTKSALPSDVNLKNLEENNNPAEVKKSIYSAIIKQVNIHGMNPSKDSKFVLRSLLMYGAKPSSKSMKKLEKAGIELKDIKSHKFRVKFSKNEGENHYAAIVRELKKYDSDPSLTLKSKKQLAFSLIENNVAHLTKKQMNQLKSDINQHEKNPQFRFIKQLRSSLWLVRKIRGMYGRSSTLSDINQCIDKAIQKELSKSAPSYCIPKGGFFLQSSRSLGTKKVDKENDKESFNKNGNR